MLKDYSLKNFAVDVMYDILGCFLYASGIVCFAVPANFATGGIAGIALILNHLTKTPIGTVQMMLNIPLILISLKILGTKFVFKTAKTIFILSLMLNNIGLILPEYQGDPVLAAIYNGIFCGCGLGIVFLHGGSAGGTDFITMIIKKKSPHMSIGTLTMILDVLVILFGGVAFKNIDACLYGAISAFILGTVCDRILFGVGAGKMALIVTTKGKEISDEIYKVTGRGSSIIKVRGAYSGTEREMVMSAMSKHQVFPIRRAAHMLDDKSFVIVSSTDEVFGEGFMENK